MDNKTAHDKQVSDNFEAFQKILPSIVDEHRGKEAVLHDGKVVKMFVSLTEAYKFGVENYGDMFSIQEVTDVVLDMPGFYYAAPQRQD